MTVEDAWDKFRRAILEFREGLIGIDEVNRAHTEFLFFFSGKTQGEA